METVCEYMSERFRMNNYSTNNLRPSFVKNMFEFLINSISQHKCDIIVFGSSNGRSTDILTRDAAVALGIPTVVELLNLFPDEKLLPTAYVAPSHYSAQHHSITKAVALSNSKTQVLVIPPSVDTHKFNKSRIPFQYIMNPHKSCVAIDYFKNKITHKHNQTQSKNKLSLQLSAKCIHIGFIGRLEKEKSPGLFIQFASVLIHSYYPFVRFTIIGDGVLKTHLEDLAKRLDLDWAIRFIGWTNGDLPYVMASLDLLVNPSLRFAYTINTIQKCLIYYFYVLF